MSQFIASLNTQQQVIRILEKHQVDHYGFTSLKKPESIGIYKDWLARHFHGEMGYLKTHLPQKESPTQLLDNSVSAITVGVMYSHSPKHLGPISDLKIAKYAQGLDYHDWLKEKLEVIVLELKSIFSNAQFLVATDSMPILERDLAYQSGLGWFGRNSCLIDQKRGSYFLIGEILTTMELTRNKNPHPDMCGTCTRCITSCPTQAIREDKTLDARQCISYLTIESQSIPDVSLRKSIGHHFFGCDICQDVCPWNLKRAPHLANIQAELDRGKIVEGLRFILNSSGKVLNKILCHTPVVRARPFGLKRNALIVAANFHFAELRPDVEPYLEHPRLSELAYWTLDQL